MGVGMAERLEEVSLQARCPDSCARRSARGLIKPFERTGVRVLDLTCPFVSRIHDIVRKQRAAGRRILIAGSPDHPEVRGIAGHGGGDAVVIESAEQAERSIRG